VVGGRKIVMKKLFLFSGFGLLDSILSKAVNSLITLL
jgi:hypothetical protein